MATGGRFHSLGDPAVQVVQRGPQQGRVVHAVEGQLSFDPIRGADLDGREIARTVLAAGKVVTANRWRLRGVGQCLQVGVYQGRVAPPVLGGGVGEHYLWHVPLPFQGIEQRTLGAGHRITLGSVGKGKHLRDDVANVLGGLPEAQIELAPHPAGNMGDDTIQGRPALLIVIDAHVDVLTQKASALRAAHGVGVVDGVGAGVPC